jgi:hypothetical protein
MHCFVGNPTTAHSPNDMQNRKTAGLHVINVARQVEKCRAERQTCLPEVLAGMRKDEAICRHAKRWTHIAETWAGRHVKRQTICRHDER